MAEPSISKRNETPLLAQEVPLTFEAANKIKPRALILKAKDKELSEIKKVIEERFPEVKIVYITTGSSSCILKVIKLASLEHQHLCAQPLYVIE
jgi:hypothetical protein